MKKDQSRKLNLVRETITPMQKDQLADVNGGAQSVSVSASRGESRSVNITTWQISVSRGESAYVAECWEVAVVTQGRTLDEVVANVREALTLHLEGEDLDALGLKRSPRLVVTYESSLENAPKAQTALG